MIDVINSNDVALLKAAIQDISKNELRRAKNPSYISAIVRTINEDGTVNVYLPPNINNSVTNLLNKCNEPLEVGDSVELATKNGSLSNCWVAVKHGTTYKSKETIEQLENKIKDLETRMKSLEERIS